MNQCTALVNDGIYRFASGITEAQGVALYQSLHDEPGFWYQATNYYTEPSRCPLCGALVIACPGGTRATNGEILKGFAFAQCDDWHRVGCPERSADRRKARE